MTSLARYHGRAPRYILNTEDDSLIRVAGPKQTPWEEGTEIKNVSLTGLAFMAPTDLCPILGEVVKIQFTPPGSQQIACYGIVIRLDEINESSRLVAVHFYKMEMPHRIALAQGLAKKLKDIQDRERIESAMHPQISLSHKIPTFFFMGFVLLCWLECFYLFIHFGYVGLFELARLVLNI